MNKDTYTNCYFRIEAGYAWGSGMSEEKTHAFYDEIKTLFTGEGWTIRPYPHGNCVDVIKGKTCLYVHPQEVSGPCLDALTGEVEAILKRGATFSYIVTDRYETMQDLTDEETAAIYHDETESIDAHLLAAFTIDKPRQYYIIKSTLINLGAILHIPTVNHPQYSRGTEPIDEILAERFRLLVNQGRITIPEGRPDLARTVRKRKARKKEDASQGTLFA